MQFYLQHGSDSTQNKLITSCVVRRPLYLISLHCSCHKTLHKKSFCFYFHAVSCEGLISANATKISRNEDLSLFYHNKFQTTCERIPWLILGKRRVSNFMTPKANLHQRATMEDDQIFQSSPVNEERTTLIKLKSRPSSILVKFIMTAIIHLLNKDQKPAKFCYCLRVRSP